MPRLDPPERRFRRCTLSCLLRYELPESQPRPASQLGLALDAQRLHENVHTYIYCTYIFCIAKTYLHILYEAYTYHTHAHTHIYSYIQIVYIYIILKLTMNKTMQNQYLHGCGWDVPLRIFWRLLLTHALSFICVYTNYAYWQFKSPWNRGDIKFLWTCEKTIKCLSCNWWTKHVTLPWFKVTWLLAINHPKKKTS